LLCSKGEKITAKAHGGVIDIQGVTIATVDEAVRLQAVDTWFDPLEMFRQIAPGGIVNKQIMNRKVELEHAPDTVESHNDGIKIAEQHNGESSEQHNGESSEQHNCESSEQHNGESSEQHSSKSLEHANDPAPEDMIPKHISNGTGEAADAFVPHQGADPEKAADQPPADPINPAQEIVASAAVGGADAELSRPTSNFEDASTTLDTSKEESSVQVEQPNTFVDKSRATQTQQPDSDQLDTEVDESRATGTYNAIDEHLENSAEEVHPHPRDMEEIVQPGPGKAVAAPADSMETKMTHEEMSQLGSAGECPFLMNRE
jgi:hypothetical protein